jgi:hypothetical protein
MSLLGLELSDAGIMVAAKDPVGLLQIDGADRESPGFALPERNRLLIGRAAESKAHLHPRQFNNLFWDQLNTEPLKQPSTYAQNHAEMAFAHLAQIWENIKGHGDGLVIAVPGFLDRDQLGLVLGIAEELSMPLKGIVALAIAATSKPCPERLLLHLDIHLHRSEITFLEQGESLDLQDPVTAEGLGLHDLYRAWVETIAGEFVHTTRFDPLHRAISEQELYNRLPDVLAALQQDPFVMFEMTEGPKSYRVSLSRDLFIQKSEVMFREILRLIAGIRERHGKPGQPVTLQLSQRISRLPGCKEMVAKMTDTQALELEPGSAAFGALDLRDELSGQKIKRGVSFLTSRPWQGTKPRSAMSYPTLEPVVHAAVRPTHLLYRNMAYPISDQPLIIGRGSPQDGVGLTIEDEVAGVSRRHCSIQRRSKEVVLTDHSTYGTFVDEFRVTGTAVLKLGQIIRVGTPGEKLQLIACVEKDET